MPSTEACAAYVVLNYLAFCKILKKFDKQALGVPSAQGGVRDRVLHAVQGKSFYCSKRLAKLLTEAQCAGM